MKKLRNSIVITLIALFAISFTTTSVNAQSFEQGDFDLNLTIGFGNTWYYSSYYKMGIPFISVGADYALIDSWGPGVFGVGGIIGFNTYKFGDYYAVNDFKETDISIVPRATYHYQWVDKLDTYGGLGMGFKIRTYSEDFGGLVPNTTEFVFTVFIGAKYYVTDNLAIMSEIYFYDLALFNIGVGFKF